MFANLVFVTFHNPGCEIFPSLGCAIFSVVIVSHPIIVLAISTHIFKKILVDFIIHCTIFHLHSSTFFNICQLKKYLIIRLSTG